MESANEVDENGPLARSIIPVPRRERAATCFDPRGWFVHSKLTPGVATRRDPFGMLLALAQGHRKALEFEGR